MMDIDWSKAPEGATHYDPSDDGMNMPWVKLSKERFYCWEDKVGWIGPLKPNDDFFSDGNVDRLIHRPTKPASPEIMSDDCLAAKIGEIGNQIHNLGCDKQNDEGLSDRLGELAIALWDLAKRAPADSAAPEWDGDGLPPVGCECERFSIEDGQWHGPARVFHITKMGVCFVEYEHGGWDKSINPADFRPLRTKEQREREELHSLITDAWVKGGFHKVTDAILSRYNLEKKQ